MRYFPAECYDAWYSMNQSAFSKRDKCTFDEYLQYRYPLFLDYLNKKA